MKKILLAILLFSVTYTYGQTVGQFRYDTTKFLKVGGYNEVKILNSTMGVTGGVFTNVGNGWGQWVLPAAGGSVDSISVSNDSLYYWSSGTAVFVTTLTAAISGNDTTIFEVVLDSTGNQNNRILFARNNKISSSPRLLTDSTNSKIVINNANVSVGGPNTKLWVTGNTNITGSVTGGTIIKSGGTSSQFLMADGSVSLGSGGTTNTNLGAGYRWAVPNTNGIKTAFAGYGVTIDSTTNANGLTFKVDTTLIVPQDQMEDLTLGGDYLFAPTPNSIAFDSSKVVIDVTKVNDSTLRIHKGNGTTDIEINGNGGGGSGGSGWATTGGNAGGAYPDTLTYLGTNNLTPLRLKTNGTQAIIIDSAGNIGLNKPANATVILPGITYKVSAFGTTQIQGSSVGAAADAILNLNPTTGGTAFDIVTKYATTSSGSTIRPINYLIFTPTGTSINNSNNVNVFGINSNGNSSFGVLNDNTGLVNLNSVNGTTTALNWNQNGVNRWALQNTATNGDFRLTYNTATTVLNVDDATNNIDIGTTTSVASAMLQLSSTTKGFLPPRMTTTQKNAISSPAEGLIIYDTTLKKLCFYNGTAWETVTSM